MLALVFKSQPSDTEDVRAREQSGIFALRLLLRVDHIFVACSPTNDRKMPISVRHSRTETAEEEILPLEGMVKVLGIKVGDFICVRLPHPFKPKPCIPSMK